MPNMIICHVSTTFVARAGSARRTYNVLRGLADSGYEVINIYGGVFEMDNQWDFSGIKNISVPCLVKYISPRNDYLAYGKLKALLRSLAPDVVHTHLAKAGVIGRLAAHSARVPHIFHTVHGPTFSGSLPFAKRSLYRMLERIAASYTERTVFVGDDIRREYIHAGICRAESTEVIRTGRPDVEFEKADAIDSRAVFRMRRALGISPSHFVLGCVGRVVPSKAQNRALNIAAHLKNAGVNVKLLIIGEAFLPEEKKYMEILKEQAIQQSLQDNVLFLGFRKNIFLYMKTCDVIIMVSKYEGLPNVALEAGISNRPVVGLEVNGLLEVIADGNWGKVFAQNEETALSSYLLRLAHNPQLLKTMASGAGKEIRRLYSRATMIDKKLALYASVSE